MKQRLILLACGCLALTVGCTQNLLDKVDAQPNFETSTISTGEALSRTTSREGMLAFESKEHMDQALRELMQMSVVARQQWYAQQGFTSIDALYDAANEEINKMMCRSDYDAICTKYADVFLFHTADSTDLPPYFRIKEMAYAPLLNGAGKAFIGGQTIDFNVYSSIEQTDRFQHEQQYKKETKTVTSTPNQLFIEDGKRKYWADAYFTSPSDVYIRVGCQVKSFWGWNTFRQSYWFSYQFNGTNTTLNQFTQIGSDFSSATATETGVVSDGHQFYFGTRKMFPQTSGPNRDPYPSAVNLYVRTRASDGPDEWGSLHVTR